MLGALAAVVATGSAVAASVFVVRRWAAGAPLFAQLALGLCTAISLVVIATYASALVGVLDAAPVVLLGMAVALRTPPGRRPSVSFEEALTAGLLITGAWVWFAIPVLDRVVPMGWDPTFHTLIIDLFARFGRVPTNWAPYDLLSPFQYPSGMHAALGAYMRWVGWSSVQMFNGGMLLVALASLLTVYALGEQLARSAHGGALAVVLYGLTDGWGTLGGHQLWGGLASMLGLLLQGAFFLACACVTQVDPPAPMPASTPSKLWTWLRHDGEGAAVRAGWLGTLFLLASAFEHHLAVVMTGTCAAVLLVAELISERRLSTVGQSVLRACLIAGVLSVLVVGLRSTGRFDVKDAMRFTDPMHDFGRSVEVLRPIVWVLGTIGLTLSFSLLRTPAERSFLTWVVGLVLFWVSWDVLYRAYMFFTEHENITAFTPTRALTNLAMPLAIAGAVALSRIGQEARLQRAVLLGTTLAVLGFVYPNQRARLQRNEQENAEARPLALFCDEVRAKTPENAALLTGQRSDTWLWLSPLCRRESNHYSTPTYTRPGTWREKNSIARPEHWVEFLKRTTGGAPYIITNQRIDAAGPPTVEVAGLYLYPLR